MTGTPRVAIQRLSDGAYYAGTSDRTPIFTARLGGAAPFERRDDAVQRALSLAGPEWGATLKLAPAPPAST